MTQRQRNEDAREILAYLAEYPGAQDTLEGIVEWWLLQRKIERQTARAREALDFLVAAGKVQEVRASDRRIHYRAHPPRK